MAKWFDDLPEEEQKKLQAQHERRAPSPTQWGFGIGFGYALGRFTFLIVAGVIGFVGLMLLIVISTMIELFLKS